MKQFSSGCCVLLVISATYLRSPNCMTHIHQGLLVFLAPMESRGAT